MRLLSSLFLGLVAVVCVAGRAHAADPTLSCESGKLKLAAKYGACRLNTESKAVRKSSTPDYARCEAQFADKWTSTESRAGTGVCPSEGDQADIEQRITSHSAGIATLLAGQIVPACGFFPASGQTTSYGPNDDGASQLGAALSYSDNGDGTISDLNTGLMWEKKIALNNSSIACTTETGSCANPHDADNTYTWTAATPGYDGRAVTIFLAQMNDRCDGNTTVACSGDGDCSAAGGLCGFAGYRDWRLPNKKELESIVDVERVGPAVASAFRGASCGLACTNIDSAACSCTASANYWSTSTFADSVGNAWVVNFGFGLVGSNLKTTNVAVRAVRGGS